MNYIKISNGTTIGHPQLLENLKDQYSNFLDRYQELGYLPCNMADYPEVTDPYLKVIPVYTIDENQVIMTYSLIPMTAEEKITYINYRKETDTQINGWVFNESTCSYDPPFLEPDNEHNYVWDEEILNWVIIPEE